MAVQGSQFSPPEAGKVLGFRISGAECIGLIRFDLVGSTWGRMVHGSGFGPPEAGKGSRFSDFGFR